MEYRCDVPIKKCPDCGYEWQARMSKRVDSCPNCEHQEKFGESIFAKKKRLQKEQRDKWQKKAAEKRKSNPPAKKKLPSVSAKGRQRAAAVSEMKRALKEDAIEGEFCECRGCGQYFKTIDASHKIPLSQSIALSTDPANITLLCRDCHNKWEHGTVSEMVQLNCFVSDMNYLFDMDPERFWKIFYRCLDEYEKTHDSKIGKAVALMEKFE